MDGKTEIIIHPDVIIKHQKAVIKLISTLHVER